MIVECFCTAKQCVHCGDPDGFAQSDTCTKCGRSRHSCRLCGVNGMRSRFVVRLNELLLEEMSDELQRAVIELDAAGFLASPPGVGRTRVLVIGVSMSETAHALTSKLFPGCTPETAPAMHGASWSWMSIGRPAEFRHVDQLKQLANRLELGELAT